LDMIDQHAYIVRINAISHINVLFLWKVREELQDYIGEKLEDSSISLVFPSEADPDTLLTLAHKADIIVGWRPNKELLDASKKLKLFINPGAGVQHLLELFSEIQKERDIVLVNGHGNAVFTAEHIIAMLLGAANQLFPHHELMKQGKWRSGDEVVKSIPIASLKIGLLGYGHVNREVHRLLVAFGPEIYVLRRHPQNSLKEHGLPTQRIYNPEELDDFLTSVNVLIVALPLTEKSKGMIGEPELELLGRRGFLINAGRGPVVKEDALYHALKENKIAAAAIDVWYDYRPKQDAEGRKYPYSHPFHELDNILLSPHRAASPMDNLERWDDVIENIKRCAAGRTDFLNVVDVREGY